MVFPGGALESCDFATNVDFDDSEHRMAGIREGIDRVLPWRPVWLALFINAAFWGVVLSCLWMLPRWIRSGVWLARRRCTVCGYPIGASPVCTECGHSIRLRTWRQRGASPAAKLKS
jgi:hypothetical protein